MLKVFRINGPSLFSSRKTSCLKTQEVPYSIPGAARFSE
jgi:hypothetical protein